ncbi:MULTISPECIES: carboxylating nicotinate-nucleotide diphosphorylase [unclassified Paracoccus (in: a-proteobacteria)]|uniref:carboxylating nicotinate-nucleotide diphosphorylase n=1 Tax=unclassified Paracoccus (in: a-proteobacteria) TaxID=2688777 RepID=UPI0012B41BBD|nr:MULTISPECIES: carboxylating nicotinate-nucleotide diphosphorylase [unclassified Paracoccus (in: a-proteobacteria)]UXU74854.1 carboxylating nicotinate-nucleotide diphosphorylase [Paracoccus sp. SMMA_5]UXU80754.1 carboxylating nicotinate-nucleotide diphosphorylase [Paracoccus sp. SMMA_5_TC]
MTPMPPLPDLILEPLVRAALIEDLGTYGDITTRTVIPAGTRYRARIVAREAGVASGMQLAAIAFRLVDPGLAFRALVGDGASFDKGAVLAEIEGEAASILTGERVALNFAGRLSGIASQTAEYVAQTAGTRARITCTRKTTPGLRLVEKQAVLHGGGFNHRFSLSDAILIKDNHIAAAGGIRPVLRAVKARASHMMRVEIEVDRLDQLAEVLDETGADVVLLDNMDTATLAEAVRMTQGRLILEASGNMRLARIAEVAATGVDYISVGALTHSARTLDLGLDF